MPQFLSLRFFCVTCRTIGCNRLVYSHCLMTLHALSVVSGHQSRFERILLVERPAVTACTTRRLFRRRAVVVTSLANRTLFAVKVIRQFVIFDVVKQRVNYFSMRKFHRLIFIRQSLDDHGFRYILRIIGFCDGLPGLQNSGSHFSLFFHLNLTGDQGCRNHVTIQAGCRTLLAFFFKRRMATGTGTVVQFAFMAPDTALVDI